MPSEVTVLSPADEAAFRSWVRTNGITDLDHPDSHYDYRGFWQDTHGAPHRQGDHYPDTYKEHGHPTFSVESKYSTGPNDGGHWNGDTFMPAQAVAGRPPDLDLNGRPTTSTGRPPDIEPEPIDAAAPPADPQVSMAPTAAMTLARSVPRLVQASARFAANHPVAVQKGINAGTTAGLAGAGFHEFGPAGAFVGASIRGLTPRQNDIVRVGSQLAGDTPSVADSAAKAQAIINYGREMGMRLRPGDIINKPAVGEGLKNYAGSQGKGILELFDEFGRPIAGPNAASRVPSMTPSSVLGKTGALLTKVLAPLQGATAMTDLAQSAEPSRTDIGMMGMSLHPEPAPPAPEALQQMNARNIAAMKTRQQTQQDQRAQVRAKILALLGVQ